MRNRLTVLLALCVAIPSIASAGAVMELLSRNASGKEVGRSQFRVQDGQVRMDDSDGQSSMIFANNRFIVLDHKRKTYLVLDDAMMEEVGSQVNSAMAEMQEQMKNMSPQERAMMEQLMQGGGMQGMIPGMSAPPQPPRVEAGGSGEWGDYECRKYMIYEGPEKTEDICAAALDDVAGGDEVMAAFRAMAVFIQDMMESMPEPLASMMGENPAAYMEQIEGFPVHTVRYRNGRVDSEESLDSVVKEDVPQDVYEVPAGYTKERFGPGG